MTSVSTQDTVPPGRADPLAIQFCPQHGGPRIDSVPWVTARDCGTAGVALIVGGRPVAHMHPGEARNLSLTVHLTADRSAARGGWWG